MVRLLEWEQCRVGDAKQSQCRLFLTDFTFVFFLSLDFTSLVIERSFLQRYSTHFVAMFTKNICIAKVTPLLRAQHKYHKKVLRERKRHTDCGV